MNKLLVILPLILLCGACDCPQKEKSSHEKPLIVKPEHQQHK